MKADWEAQSIASFAKTGAGGTPKKSTKAFYEGGNIPWLLSGEVANANIVEAKNSITPEGLKGSSAKLFPANSVLVAMYGATAGQVGILRFEAATNQAVCAILPSDQHIPEYLYYYLLHAKPSLVAQAVGNAQPNISQAKIKSLEIPLPPLEEQQRIVAVLDEAFEGLARARAHAEANLQNARELFAGTIASEFAKIEPSGKRKVGDIAVHSLGKMLDKNKNKGTLRPYLRNLNVRWFTVDTSDLLEMRITDAEVERYTVRQGDLLICEGGYPGRSSIWEEDDEIFFQKALHRVRFEDEAYSRLLMYFLYMSDQSGALQEYCSGAGIQHFTGQSLAKFEMPFPSVSVAKKMIVTIEAMHRSSMELEGHFQQKLQDIDDLRQSLLQKAFAGELT